MEQIKTLEDLLRTFPLWDAPGLQIDGTEPSPGACGLFPLGMEELSRREDVTGGIRQRLRQQFVLRRVFPRGAKAAAWLLRLQDWLPRKAQNLPGFGSDCVIRAQKGRLAKTHQAGTDIYEVTLTVEYTKENEYGEN